MPLKLEVLDAKKGDSLLLHYGTPTKPQFVLIDGGPAGVYRKSILPQLNALIKPGTQLTIPLVIVSHLDDDHIRGIQDLTDSLIDYKDNMQKVPFEIKNLWINTFDDIRGKCPPQLEKVLESGATAALACNAAAMVPGLTFECAAMLASVGQGQRVRDNARALSIKINNPFKDLVVAEDKTPAKAVTLAPGLKLTVLGPSTAELAALQKEWDAKLQSAARKSKKAAEAELADFIDKSVYNLSSIVVLAQAGKQSILLLGDARGDYVMEALKRANLLKNGKFHVNILKVPHHGSDHNVSQEFFETVTADQYVFSGDGTNGNPEKITVQWLSNARPDDNFTIHMTYMLPNLQTFFTKEKKAGRKYTVVVRDPNKPSMMVTP